MNTQEIFAPIAHDLDAVEAMLQEVGTASSVPLLSHVGGHILTGGGKRLRPALTLLAGRLCGTPSDRRVPAATAVEMIHNATLLHDDIVDEASMRRGKPPAHLLWGDPAGVLTANLHFSRAFTLILDAGGMPCLEVVNRTVHSIVEGELLQFLRVGFTGMDEAHYRDIIRRKTAQLISTACRLGAQTGPGKRFADPLARFGHHLGMAFQMMDDLLDYTAEEKVLGKKVGTDFREGKLTLPLITALARCGPDERQELLELLHGAPERRDRAFPRARSLIDLHGGFQTTHEAAAAHIDRAVDDLRDLPRAAERDALAGLARFVVERNY